VTLPTNHDGVDASLYKSMGLFGFRPEEELVRSSSIPDAIREGLASTWRTVGGMLAAFAPSKIGESVGGPILIARQTSTMVALGPYYVVLMGGVLSMSLFFVNLLPIPCWTAGI